MRTGVLEFLRSSWYARPTDGPLRTALRGVRMRLRGVAIDDSARVVERLYSVVLGRAADPDGLRHWSAAMKSGMAWHEVLQHLLNSEEGKRRALRQVLGERVLPNLRQIYPDKYITRRIGDVEIVLFHARQDADFYLLEEAIRKHRYYDAPGVWGESIDEDKVTLARTIEAFGARSCLDFGCFNGAVLSVLAARGLDVCGVELSHLAFVLAFPNVRDRLIHGDLLEATLDRTFDAILATDIIEHLSPLRVDAYVDRLQQLLDRDGYLYVNSPMFGEDPVFGRPSDLYVDEWRSADPGQFFRHLHCDELGWPQHGHLIWATPVWWTALFERHGLARETELERRIHAALGALFDRAPGRRMFFVLRKGRAKREPALTAELLARIDKISDRS